jgi:hypothetical protein
MAAADLGLAERNCDSTPAVGIEVDGRHAALSVDGAFSFRLSALGSQLSVFGFRRTRSPFAVSEFRGF